MLLTILGIIVGGVGAGLLIYDMLIQREHGRRKQALRVRVRGQPQSSDSVQRLPIIGRLIQRDRRLRMQMTLEYELPQMLEIVALGLKAGMGFDQAFGLYVYRFESELSKRCKPHFEVWARGLRGREEGMQALAGDLDFTSFTRFVSITLRAIKFGAPLVDVLLQLAADVRKECEAAMQERIAKAPVKMLLPTGVLILPAMMLLVLGPILLDLVTKMG